MNEMKRLKKLPKRRGMPPKDNETLKVMSEFIDIKETEEIKKGMDTANAKVKYFNGGVMP